jgi:hypothetical protein
MVNRRKAVEAVSARLAELIGQDQDLLQRVMDATRRQDARAEGAGADAIADLERKIRVLTNRITDLADLAGEGSDEDRTELKARVRAAQAERAGLQLEITRLRQDTTARRTLTKEDVRAGLGSVGAVIQSAASGQLGADAVYQAAEVFRRLVGGRVWVHAEQRAGRSRSVVRGRFTPALLNVVSEACGIEGVSTCAAETQIEVWLRQPPRLEEMAAEVRRLYEEEGLGFRAIAKRLGIGCGNVYSSYRRYYEMRGLPVPPRRPRGRRRST